MKKNIFLIFFIILSICGYAQDVFAAPLTQATDIMTRLRTNTAADHEIQFTLVNGVGLPDKGDTIRIYFGDALSHTHTLSYQDVSLRYGILGYELSQALYTIPGPNVWGVTMNTERNILTLTFPSSNGTPITTGQRVIIKIGTNVRSNANQLINGLVPGSHILEIIAGNFDSKLITIALLLNDAVGTGAPVPEIPPPQGGAVLVPVPAPIKTVKSEPAAPTESSPLAQPAASTLEKQPTPVAPAPASLSSEPTAPAQPAAATPILVSLGAPASVHIQANQVSSASVINTDAKGQTTGFFAEIEKNTIAEDGSVSIEPIPLSQASNLDSEIFLPSNKDVPDKVFYKINVSTEVKKPIRITIKYNPNLLDGVDPLSLKIHYWNAEKRRWISLEDTLIDTEQHTLSAYVIPKTIFAAFATITSREAVKKRGQTIIKSSIKFIPKSSGISQTDLAFTGKMDAEQIRFVHYDFYTSGGREMKLCIQKKLFLRPVASVFLEFKNNQEKLFYNKTFKCFSGFLASPIEEGTYPMKLKVLYKDDYSEIISANIVVTTPFQAFIQPIIRWISENIQSSPLTLTGIYGSLILLVLGIWLAISRRLRKIQAPRLVLSAFKK